MTPLRFSRFPLKFEVCRTVHKSLFFDFCKVIDFFCRTVHNMPRRDETHGSRHSHSSFAPPSCFMHCFGSFLSILQKYLIHFDTFQWRIHPFQEKRPKKRKLKRRKRVRGSCELEWFHTTTTTTTTTTTRTRTSRLSRRLLYKAKPHEYYNVTQSLACTQKKNLSLHFYQLYSAKLLQVMTDNSKQRASFSVSK